jgi:hypothetical protein
MLADGNSFMEADRNSAGGRNSHVLLVSARRKCLHVFKDNPAMYQLLRTRNTLLEPVAPVERDEAMGIAAASHFKQ